MQLRRRYCLEEWGHFMRDREELNQHEKEVARAFFKALSGLTKPDIALLSEKHVTGIKKTRDKQTGLYRSDQALSDQELADRHGIPRGQYTEQRHAVEIRLQKLLDKAWQREQAKRDPDEFYLYVAGMWLVAVEEGITTKLVLTRNQDRAARYTRASGNEIAKKFQCEKVPLQSDY